MASQIFWFVKVERERKNSISISSLSLTRLLFLDNLTYKNRKKEVERERRGERERDLRRKICLTKGLLIV